MDAREAVRFVLMFFTLGALSAALHNYITRRGFQAGIIIGLIGLTILIFLT